jgi:hypothetical protein
MYLYSGALCDIESCALLYVWVISFGDGRAPPHDAVVNA